MTDKKPNTVFPTNEFYIKYSSQIRPIKIHLPESKKDDKYFDFVGREKLMERIYAWLTNNSSTGSYLVTGFRGMGKTILVNRVMELLTRDISHKIELLCHVSLLSLLGGIFILGYNYCCYQCTLMHWDNIPYIIPIVLLAISVIILFSILFIIPQKKKLSTIVKRRKYTNGYLFNENLVDKLIRGKGIDETAQRYSNLKIFVNLGHEILNERDILCMIAHAVKEKYTKFVKSIVPHFRAVYFSVLIVGALGIMCTYYLNGLIESSVGNQGNGFVVVQDIRVQSSLQENNFSAMMGNHQGVSIQNPDTWMGRITSGVVGFLENIYRTYPKFALFVLYAIIELLLWWTMKKLLLRIPLLSTPQKAIKRLQRLEERIVATTDEETGATSTTDKNVVSISIFGHKKRKIFPIADVREIETELSDIINSISSHECISEYQARFYVVFDEMDKIDPEMMDMSKNINMPEYIDSVKGFPDGMSSRERRRNVLKLLANIKLFITTARAKFVFISGRELYDAYLADLSDRDFSISSIFTGVINVDSFLTPEGGQTDVRSMSEWYIANRLLPNEWLRMKERQNAVENLTLKKEMPSLKWYYEYLITECKNDGRDAAYIIGFLHIFAAYLTHISNGSPKKIFLYFDKYVKQNIDSVPYTDWNDVCEVGQRTFIGKRKHHTKDTSQVLWFNQTQQKTINFVYYLANPIMGTITNDLSNYGDRFLVTLSFVIDHIYKHHNRSFSWRNMEQIPDLLKTSKAPELREAMTSILEHMAQTHVSPILIGLNEYKFRKSISEEISVMSKLSEEASAIFNFTLDESLAVIQHNTLLLNYYIQLEQKEMSPSDNNRRFQPIIARIHSNLGDLHYWDEDYYKASLEYRAAIDAFNEADDQGFLTKIRCMLKLGLTYESRKLYPNAYQLYCRLISLLIKRRWVDERSLGLDIVETRVNGWREKRLALVDPMVRADQDDNDVRKYKYNPGTIPSETDNQEKYYLDYRNQFKRQLWEGDEVLNVEYGTNVDGVVSSFARDLTSEKVKFVSSLSMFEEIRYVYQVILAKLSILEKMGMSGITQTNIDVAEGEFKALYRSANIKEKFIISADFFRKLAEILYYKNSLTILSQNQDSFYASLYFADYDILANLDDYCKYEFKRTGGESNALEIKRDVIFFFNYLNNSVCDVKDNPHFENISNNGSLKGVICDLLTNLNEYVDQLPYEKAQYDYDKEKIKIHVKGYLDYNNGVVYKHNERYPQIDLHRINYCDYHRQELRKNNLRPPCYACKYYTRSLLILSENMFVNNGKELALPNKAFQLLRLSFKEKLLYTRSIHIDTLAQTIEGFANVIFSCSSGDKNEIPKERTQHGLSPDLIQMMFDLCSSTIGKNDNEILEIIDSYRNTFSRRGTLSRLDKCILYYFDAFRFYIIGTSYGDAVRCLNKIITILAYYVEVVSYYKTDVDCLWGDESETIIKLIGEKDFEESLVSSLFTLIVRYTGYMYDLTNLTEIHEMKWIFSRQYGNNIDLARLSLYPNIRASFLRILEIVAKGNRYLSRKRPHRRSLADYQKHVQLVYPLIAPARRYETTFNEETLGFYTKLRFNDHILNNILLGNPMLEAGVATKGNATYHILFYRKIADYLSPQHPIDRLDQTMFNVGNNPQKKLDLLEFLIHDSLVCLANITQVFTPHNHLTSYSKSFIGVVYNYFWEWSRKYEFMYSLYKYSEVRHSNSSEADDIIDRICSGIRIGNKTATRQQLFESINKCSDFFEQEENTPFGKRSARLYEKLRHDIDDITLGTIFSNYTAEMAINYYNMSEEFNTEGDSYKDMISMMHFLDDDFNNDTCQFHIACDRFLLNTGIVQRQRYKLEKLYCNSNVYNVKVAYIDGPKSSSEEQAKCIEQFDESLFINSEY